MCVCVGAAIFLPVVGNSGCCWLTCVCIGNYCRQLWACLPACRRLAAVCQGQILHPHTQTQAHTVEPERRTRASYAYIGKRKLKLKTPALPTRRDAPRIYATHFSTCLCAGICVCVGVCCVCACVFSLCVPASVFGIAFCATILPGVRSFLLINIFWLLPIALFFLRQCFLLCICFLFPVEIIMYRLQWVWVCVCEREWATAEFNNNKKKGRANIFKKRNMPVSVCVCSSIVVCVLVCVCFCVCRVCLSVCLIASVLSVPRINYLATLCSNSTNFLCFNALCGRCIINSSRVGVVGKKGLQCDDLN